MAVTTGQYISIPVTQNAPWYSFRINLSQVLYNLEIRYNLRMARWILSIYDAAQNPLLMGIPMLINRDLKGQYATLALPPGVLFTVDDSGKNLEATLSSFLLDHRFIYAQPSS